MYFVSQIQHFDVSPNSNLIKKANDLLSIPIPSDYDEKAILVMDFENLLNEFEAHSNISWVEATNYLEYNHLLGWDSNAVWNPDAQIFELTQKIFEREKQIYS